MVQGQLGRTVPIPCGWHSECYVPADGCIGTPKSAGGTEATTSALYTLAILAQTEDEDERARNLFEEGLKMSAELGD
jgi:hypothetical protein